MIGLLGIVVDDRADMWPLVAVTALLIVAVERVLAAAERWRGRE